MLPIRSWRSTAVSDGRRLRRSLTSGSSGDAAVNIGVNTFAVSQRFLASALTLASSIPRKIMASTFATISDSP